VCADWLDSVTSATGSVCCTVRACERAAEGNMAVCTVVVTTDELLLIQWGTGGPSEGGPAENLITHKNVLAPVNRAGTPNPRRQVVTVSVQYVGNTVRESAVTNMATMRM